MLLKNCRLLPELSPFDQVTVADIIVEDGKIKTIREAGSATGDDSESFDAGGRTLLPGLIDLHTHITLLSNVGNDSIHEPMQLLTDAAKQAQRFLDFGFTTIRDCGSYFRVANYVRNLVEDGMICGPRILACGQILMPSTEKPGDATTNLVDGAEGFRRGVRCETAYQPDFIKIYASGSALSRTGVPKHPIMEREEIRKAVETAEANGLYVAAHCHADSAIRHCIKNGVKTIEHATFIEEETLNLLEKAEECYLVPTFAAMYVSQTDPEDRVFWEARLNPMLQQCAKGMEAAYRAGQKLGFGTDSAPGSPQYERAVEFAMRKEYCHMENTDILLQSTKYNAEIAGLDQITGDIREGLAADLIMVDGNPDEDLSVMYGKPSKVWKSGKLVRG